MKTQVPLLLSLLLLTSTAFAGWSSSGPTGGAVNAVVVAASDPSVVWAGNAAGVFRSVDGGATWSSVGGPLADVGFLAVHPSNPNKAWALTYTAHVYRTDDGGATWIDSSAGLAGVIPSGLAIDPRDPDTVYVGSSCGPATIDVSFNSASGVFKSTDGGATWTHLQPGGTAFTQCVYELSVDPFSPWRLFVSGPFGGASETYDGSQTWQLSSGPRPARGVLFDPRFPFTHYGISAQNGPKFVVSQDGGFTWKSPGGNLPGTPLALSIDPQRGRLFLGTNLGVFRSGNGGTVWADTLAPIASVSALDFGGAPPSLFAATSEGLFQVVNRGLGEALPIDLAGIATLVGSVAADPNDSNVLYAGVLNGNHGRTFRSTNGGASWERVAGDDDVIRANFLSVDAAGTLYASAYSGNAVYRRGRNDGKWTRVLDQVIVSDLAADPKNAGTLFVARFGGVERTRDGGATWTPVTNTSSTSRVAIDPSDPRWVYVSNVNQLLRSGDGGDTWTDVEPFVAGKTGTSGVIVVAPSNGKVLYRVGYNFGRPRPERSDDRAESWHPMPLPNGVYPEALAVDPRNEQSVWASAGTLVYHSANGGTAWEKVDGPFVSTGFITSLRFDAGGHVLHVGFSNHGVWELTVE
jgi:photosystem II stability/assembly factor-like uncharacterized protein